LHFPPLSQVPLQQSEAIVHAAPGCPLGFAPIAQQTLLLFVSQMFEQQSVFALHVADTAAHMLLPSPAASLVELLSAAEESPVDWPSVCICASAGGDGESSADVSDMPGASIIELGASYAAES
jgi:hypothetical protein